jgi:hypothetical protein
VERKSGQLEESEDASEHEKQNGFHPLFAAVAHAAARRRRRC